MNKGTKITLIIFSSSFLIILSCLIYFFVFKSKYYSQHELNTRVFEERNKYIRGRILDRNGRVLVHTEVDNGNKKRIYNYGEPFLHPVGYFSEKYGMYGIEKYMDEYLREPRGVISNLSKIFVNSYGLSGSDVKLTLHQEIQEYCHRILGDKKGGIVVTNPITGEIYAMVSKPSFDPNYINDVWNDIYMSKDAPFYNRATNGMYAPGSTFKIITSAAAIENIHGILHRQFDDQGYMSFNENEKLTNQNERSYGYINLNEAFVNSSNTFFGTISIEMKNEILKEYAEKFYFNKDIHIEGISVSTSYFPQLDYSEVGLIAQSGIGQGTLLSTPILMSMVCSVIANDGFLNMPYIISDVLDNYGNILLKIGPLGVTKVIDSYTSKHIKSYMKDVVNYNLSHIEKLIEINAAGKTGTADHKKDGIDGVPHSWFVGFAPYDNPKVCISVIVEEGGEGRAIASRIAGDVMANAISLLK